MDTKDKAAVMQCLYAIKDMTTSAVGEALVSSKTLGTIQVNDKDLKYVLLAVENALDLAIDRSVGRTQKLLNKS